MAINYQNFTNPIGENPPSGWAGLNDNIGNIFSGAGNSMSNYLDQRQKLQFGIALEQAKALAEQQAKQSDPLYQLRMEAINQMRGNPEFAAMFGGGQQPSAPTSSDPSVSGNAANFNPMNPVAQPNVSRYTMNPNFMFGGNEPFAENPAYKQQQANQKTKDDEIIKGPAEAAVGKITLAKESLKNIDDIVSRLFPDGTPKSFKRTTAFASNVPGGQFPGVPNRLWGEAEQDVFRKMGASLAARQLIQTGVAARPEETSRLVSQFAPTFASNPESAFRGLQELKKFYEDYLSIAEPSKRLGQGQPSQAKQLDANTAKQLLQMAGGDKDKARELAKQQGYSF